LDTHRLVNCSFSLNTNSCTHHSFRCNPADRM
jgi:hypothetical protein